jgi:hypothetical protein
VKKKTNKFCKDCKRVACFPYDKGGYICSGISLKPTRPYDKIRLCINGTDGLDVDDYAVEEALDITAALSSVCSVVITNDKFYKKVRHNLKKGG